MPILLVLALLIGCACGGPVADSRSVGSDPESGSRAGAAIEVIDDAGKPLRLAAPARRVVSLIPARTDAILALGAADRLIVRTRWDEDSRLAHLPSLGDALTPSVEWLSAQQPDLVIAWPDEQSRSVVDRLVQLGIPVYASRVQTLADVRRAVSHIGALLGIEEAADSLLRSIAAEHAAVRAAVADRARPRVLYLIGLDPVMAAGSGTFVHELIELAGGSNVFGDVATMWPQVSLEEIVRRVPDAILIAAGGTPPRPYAEVLATRPGWRDLEAVRAGRVHQLDASLFNRPGPSVGPAARQLATLLHPARS